ncbi:MAG: hypothetical protein ACRCX2_24630 [Paraclostridium sp.]
MKINVSSDVNAIPERKVNTIDPKDKEKWEIEWEINHLRTEIRKDMQDYKLLWTDKNIGRDDPYESYLFLPQHPQYYNVLQDNIYYEFSTYLNQRIAYNITKLQELVEQENE